MASTRVRRVIGAPGDRVFAALLDRDREGKTVGRSDTYRGRFVRIVPDGLSAADNELGRRESLDRLAALLEADTSAR